ncbi:lyase family protein, partial [Candidatus Margulisiibacteriota bacterium]
KDESKIIGNDEDIHSCVERLTTEKLGDLGKKIHTGKSRNDQVVTDEKLYLKDEIKSIINNLEGVLKTIWDAAKNNLSIIFPGCTHFQPAQPVLLAHYLLAYFEMLARDRLRFEQNLENLDFCPLGSGALAGNNYQLDRAAIARELGFSKLSKNSMDAVADRDFVLEFAANAAICSIHLSIEIE